MCKISKKMSTLYFTSRLLVQKRLIELCMLISWKESQVYINA